MDRSPLTLPPRPLFHGALAASLTAALTLFACATAHPEGALDGERAPDAAAPRILTRPSPLAQLPFEGDFGLIFVDVPVEGRRPLHMLLDTGFDVSVLDAGVVARLDLPTFDTQTVAQPGGDLEIGTLAPTGFSFGGLALSSAAPISAPIMGLSAVVGRPLEGIIGHDLLSQRVVAIDYDAGMIRIYRPETYVPEPGAVEMAVTILEGEVFVDGAILGPDGEEIPARLKLDTGSLDALGLNRNFVEAYRPFPEDGSRIPVPGVAVGGETEGYVSRLAGLRIGPFSFPRPVAAVTTDSGGFEDRADAGTVGAAILSRFTLVLDYPHSRIFLTPGPAMKAPLDLDHSGLRLEARGDDFQDITVAVVVPGSPGAHADIAPGDRLVSINGQRAATLGLGEIWSQLQGPISTQHRLELARDGVPFEATLTLGNML